jgi:fucose permease
MTGEWIAVTIASAIAFGMILPLLSSIRVPLAEHLRVEEPRIRSLVLALHLALIPMVWVAGVLVDMIGTRWVLVGGSLLTGVAFYALARSPTYLAALFSILLAGAGSANISVAAIVLMPEAFFPENPAASQNLGNVFFCLGALVTPVLADLLLRGLSLRRALSVVGVCALAPGALALLAPDRTLGEHVREPGAVLASPVLWVAALVLFLYTPIEGAMYTWAKTYFGDLGHRERSATWLVSGFWLAFLAGRFITSLILQRGTIPEAGLIVFLAVVAGVLLGNLASVPNKTGGTFGFLATGFVLGPIFPTLVGILFQAFHRPDYGTAYGAMFAIGTGASLAPSALINRAARQKARAALRIPAVMALLLGGAALVLGLIR